MKRGKDKNETNTSEEQTHREVSNRNSKDKIYHNNNIIVNTRKRRDYCIYTNQVLLFTATLSLYSPNLKY